ncbi:MAG: sulfatase-like hydrolase/transferase [Bryobacterales bacterium]|nr:sulfatase-like hydrolase/transferase [Bryobacterales bacterium]
MHRLILLALAVLPLSATPNVVLIMADDMGYECISANGGTSYATPVFERVAHEGMRFSNCYSQPVCTPSRIKIMTGKYNWRNYRRFGRLEKGQTTFAHLMRQAGYVTGLTGKWQLWGGPETPQQPSGTTPDEAGFDEHMYWAYKFELSADEIARYGSVGPPGDRATSRFWHPGILKNNKYVHTTMDDYGPDMFSDFALDFIERHKAEPFFLYYPMVLTHSPFVATPHSETVTEKTKFKSNPAYFADMVSYTDYLVGRLLEHIDQLGIAENTLVLFTGDNGTHRSLESKLGTRLVRGGKAFPEDAGTHVPLFARWTGQVPAGLVNDDLIEFSDFFATLVDLVDRPMPAGDLLDGRSFLPQLLGGTGNPRDWIFVHYDRDPFLDEVPFPRVRFARTKRFKLYDDGRFYDVPHDWDEERPLDPSIAPAGAATIRTMLQEALDLMPAWNPNNSGYEKQ